MDETDIAMLRTAILLLGMGGYDEEAMRILELLLTLNTKTQSSAPNAKKVEP